MKATFTQPFGEHEPGDEIELPDGCVYDHSYLQVVGEEAAPVTDSAPAAPKGGDK